MAEFLFQAKSLDWDKHNPAGFFLSEKLDGQRCMWDGGVSRGVPKTEVPWANNDKDERYVTPPIATGLWSRYGNVIHAPDWFLDTLPDFVCDGELYLGRGRFQETRKIVSRLEPDDRWRKIKYHIFDTPSERLFEPRTINNPQYKKVIDASCLAFFKQRGGKTIRETPFERRCLDPFPGLHYNKRLPDSRRKAIDCLIEELDRVVALQGEGLMVRHPNSIWTPKRSTLLLKVKPLHDSEATVTGFVTGELGKLRGMMGAMILSWKGKSFECSGFTDQERTLKGDAKNWAWDHPGTRLPEHYTCESFKIGDVVTFKYVSLTDAGIPREARYMR